MADYNAHRHGKKYAGNEEGHNEKGHVERIAYLIQTEQMGHYA